MNWRWLLPLLACLLAALSGCATNGKPTITGHARPAISPASVRVYETAPRRFEEIGIVEGETVAALKVDAAALGANGVFLRGVVPKPGPVLGFGLGSTTYDFDHRHSAIGIGTGASYALPLDRQLLQAAAIYVP